MNRYNQGFYKFGPMEQTSNGKWVKHEDVVPLENVVKDLRKQVASLECQVANQVSETLRINLKRADLFSILCVSELINAVLIGVILFVK